MNLNNDEIEKVVIGECANPHNVLGMHFAGEKNKEFLVVRGFFPDAKQAKVVDLNTDTTFEMKRIYKTDLFQLEFKERNEIFPYKFEITDYLQNTWRSYDSYSFLPQISEFDRYLFNAGNHYEIYNFLGANFKTVNGIHGVCFGVWAPNAKRVSVIGDFNIWDGRRNPMRLLGNSGVWELFIPELKEFDRYKFEIKSQNNVILEKSDPYGSFHELRPSKASLIYDRKGYNWNDAEWISKRCKENALDGPVNIYEVHLGSWKRNEQNTEGFMTYAELADQLIPYVKEMGYTHIEIMPVTEFPFDGSWGYQVTGYYAPTSRYGTPKEFMYLIDQCHKNNIGIILDWVPAHFPKDGNGLSYFDGTRLYGHEDSRRGEHPQWGTLIFNYGRNEVSNFLIANALYWIEEFHIDGIRVDAVASMLYLDFGKESGGWIANEHGGRENLEAAEFLKHMNSVIFKRNPNILMIAEESTSYEKVSRPAEDGGLGFNLKWNMGWMNDFLSYMKTDCLFRKFEHDKLTFGMMYAYTENFVLVLSHDEVVHEKKSMLNKMPGDLWQKIANLKAGYGFMFGHPGKKLLFMGGEFGQFIEWDEKRSLDWFLLEYEHHQCIQTFVKDLNSLYKEEPAFWFDDFKGQGFQWLSCDDREKSILVFARYSDNLDETLIFVVNFTPETYTSYDIPLPFEGEFKEILNSDCKKYFGSGIINDYLIRSRLEDNNRIMGTIKIAPLSVTIFKKA